MKVFLASYQVCRRATTGPGPVDAYRRDSREVLAVCDRAEELASVIAQNVKLEAGEVVDVTQLRELRPGLRVYFKEINGKGELHAQSNL